MAEGTTGSTVPRRQLGRNLRDLRGHARLTVKAAALALEWSEAKMWRIETGQTSMRSHDVETMCKVYGAPEGTTRTLMGLAKETKARGWWMSYTDVIPESLTIYIGLEEAAAKLSGYESELVPGLLQTERYARTLIQTDNPDVDEAEIERRVQVRLARQTLVSRVTSPLQLSIVLNEGILRRPIGGAEVMAEQLQRVVEVGQRDNVSIRVAPWSAELHHGVMSGPFAMLEFPTNGNGQASEPTTVYVDGFTGALFLDKPFEIERYNDAFNNVWNSSLSEVNSMNRIAAAAREMMQ